MELKAVVCTRYGPPEVLRLHELATPVPEIRPVIDRTYPLDDIVEVHRYVDNGHKRGNVVVAVT